MKKTFVVKILLAVVIATLILTLSSCDFLFDGLSDSNDGLNDETTKHETPKDTTDYESPKDTTNYDNGLYDDTQDDENESQISTIVTITTTANDTDNYGLAGSYTMLKSKQYRVGDKAELTATVNEGYNFEGWYIVEKTGSGYYEQTKLTLLSDNASYTYTVQNKDITIAAIFSYYTVTTTSSTNTGGAAGSFTRLNDKKISNGEAVALTASVNDGYNFEGWYVDGICVSRDLTYTYTMVKENINFEARYSCYYLSTVGYAKDADGNTEAGFNAGTYTKYSSENLSAGETVTLTATVNDGYNFVGWFINGNCVETDLEYTHTMEKSSVTIEAVYNYYVLSTSAKYTWDSYKDSVGANTSVHSDFSSPSMHISPIYESQKISIGTSITVEAQDIEGYTFYAWRTIDSILCPNKTYTFNMSSNDLGLYALYIRNN